MRILTWNMGAAFGFRGAKHELAWEWLNAQEADVALLQEVVPRPEFTSAWGSTIWTNKYQNWGSAVLTKANQHVKWSPTDAHPWLRRIGGAVAIAQPVEPDGLWFVSVHSDASSFENTHKRHPNTYAHLPSRDGIARCSTTEMWEIEPLAHELRPTLRGQQFVMGGDLNSSRLFDTTSEGENWRLFENLKSQGYQDLGTRQGVSERQTYFKQNARPFQLDYVFGDGLTESRVRSWKVHTQAARELNLSDHAPIEIEID